MTEQRKRSDTSLINFMHNHKIAVWYNGNKWVAATDCLQGLGDTVRLALYDLETNKRGTES